MPKTYSGARPVAQPDAAGDQDRDNGGRKRVRVAGERDHRRPNRRALDIAQTCGGCDLPDPVEGSVQEGEAELVEVYGVGLLTEDPSQEVEWNRAIAKYAVGVEVRGERQRRGSSKGERRPLSKVAHSTHRPRHSASASDISQRDHPADGRTSQVVVGTARHRAATARRRLAGGIPHLGAPQAIMTASRIIRADMEPHVPPFPAR